MTTVFTNGVFDILHQGHVRLLQHARSLGGELVVGINDDESVGRLKGGSRPVQPLHVRMAVVAALRSADDVLSFGEDTPERLIRELKPDILVKGADWRGKEVAGAKFVESSGGRVEYFPLVKCASTSEILMGWFKRWYNLEHVHEV